MFTLSENITINLYNLSRNLNNINIAKLEIVSINLAENNSRVFQVFNPAFVEYLEVGIDKFISILGSEHHNFKDNNINCMYILRNGNYNHIKTLITKIEGYNVSIVRGSSQKSHIISPK